MPDTTPRLAIDELAPRQDGAEDSHNGALRRIEVPLGRSVASRTTTAPPGSPTDGDAFIVPPSATGAWAGKDGQISYDQNGSWKYMTAREGMRLHVEDEDLTVEYHNGTWAAVDGIQTLTDAATITWDASKARTSKVTLGGNRTLASATSLFAGWIYIVIVVQDSTGSRTLTWPSEVKWAAGSAPTLSTGINDVDVFGFLYDGTDLLELYRALNVS